MIDINNIGSYNSITALWTAHPEGGNEGDYAMIGPENARVKYRWNKYDRLWENAETVTQSPARETKTFDGDVMVGNDATVAGNLKVLGLLRARGVKQPNCGLFSTIAKLREAYPNPEVGMWAVVGSTVPGEIWSCATAGQWTDTGEMGGIDNIDYEVITTLQDTVTALATALNTLTSGDTTTAIESFNEIIDFLEGMTDDETLAAALAQLHTTDTALGSAITSLQNLASDGFRLRGVATPSTNPGLPTGRIAYLAYSAGTYSHFNDLSTTGVVIGDNEVALLLWPGTATGQVSNWTKVTLDIAKKSVVEELISQVQVLDRPASIYNPTIEKPIDGYYTLFDADNETLSAVNAAITDDKCVLGLILSFESGPGIWKTYQYIGRNTNAASWTNVDNWKDFGSLAAGSEPYIIINTLVGAPTVGEYYTLETAVQALIAYQQSSGVNYAKKGLIISYATAENTMETKQFQGEVSDFGEVGLWRDFGGGGSDIEAKDEPESGGTDAFSTGGAYTLIPVNIEQVESENENEILYQMKNAAGDPIGDPFSVPFGTGGGGGGGSTKLVSINFEHSPFYAAAGGQFILKASIRSIVNDGTEQTTEPIESITIVDRDTNQVLYNNATVNQPSSDASDDFSFIFDLSTFFANAGSRRLRLTAVDTAGDQASRSINVTAVDVTVQTPDSLNANYVLTTDTAKSLSLYKFPNNQSDQGIRATVKILIGGTWQTLGQAVIQDTYTHNVSINPSDVAGYSLQHGSYLLKIQGEDVASGTLGNIIYTSLMVINPASTTPVVAIRYNDLNNGSVKLYETVKIDVAVYSNTAQSVPVILKRDGVAVSSFEASKNRTYSISQQITGVDTDGTVSLAYQAFTSTGQTSGTITLTVSGSAIDVALTSGAIFNFDFATRSNQESDHSIVSNGKTITLQGVNWSSNGFVNFLGQNALRIAEKVTGALNHAPFSSASLESTGMALQFAFSTRHIADPTAHLIDCYDENSGAGFYVTGNKVAIYCKNGVAAREERAYPNDEIITVGIVVEPSNLYHARDGVRYSMMKLYLNGEEAACLGYVPGASNLLQTKNITFDGTYGDLYLYWLIGWENFVEWQQAFYNYLVKLTNTEIMVQEYDFENVFPGSTVNGPTAAELASRGMPYLVEAPYNGSDVAALDNTTSTSQKNYITLYYYDPVRPWRSFVATDVQRRNQGTTSAKRPIKNARYYLAKSKGSGKNTTVTPLYPDYTNEDAILTYKLFALNKVRVGENTLPVDIITVKVDYSDSSNANDCGACNMMNATYRMLGDNYLTPAQRFYDGTWDKGDVHLTGLQLNHSTANHPIAMFRSADDTLSNLVFYAKGNWKEDKGEQVALGFKDTPGYNKGCINYGDFTEYFGTSGETLDQIEARFKAESGLDTSKLYLLSLYCGSSYRFMRYIEGEWTATTGSMRQVNNHWVVTGDVLNPVEGFELITYQGFDWFQGVDSVATMMEMKADKSSWVQKLVDGGDISADTFPAWTYYFECMVDDDQLAIDYALGKKVPHNLYRFLRFCDSCDYSKVDGWQTIWRQNLYKYANPYALFVYDAFTDYLAAIDQQAKNMQPMWFLDDGGSVSNGEYSDEKYLRMYPNKIYDADGLLAKDNDGGATVDPEVDPNKPSDPETGYANPYAGWGSVLWNNIYRQQSVYVNAAGEEIALRTVVAAMRSNQTTVDGLTLKPFSPEGAKHFFVDNILKKWQKTVSSFDGEKKFISFTESADAIYFYALHGLRLTAIPDFIDKRFRFRDGFYQTGLFFDGVLSARVNAASGTRIKIKAAKTGYFGIGNDASGNLSESCYLEAGETYYFTNFSHQEGALLYIYQCNRMSELDLSEISLGAASFSALELVEKLSIGSLSHTNLNIGSYDLLTSLPLGDMPFLRELDIRNTLITTVDASGCPRLEKVYASGSRLASYTAAETSPIDTLQLPNTITELALVNLPELTYPGGLSMAGVSNLTTLRVAGCPGIDSSELLLDLLDAGASLSRIRMSGINAKSHSSVLEQLIASGVRGIDADGIFIDETDSCSGLLGTWKLTNFVTDEKIAEYSAYFPNLNVMNVQYTLISFDDTIQDEKNISNLENQTGYDYDNDYAPSGHISNILAARHPVLAKYQGTRKMLCCRLNEDDLAKFYDGTTANLAGGGGGTEDQGDVFVYEPHYWYKGINDHRNNKKYHAYSSLTNTPQDPGAESVKVNLASLELFTGKAVYLPAISDAGDEATIDDALTDYASYNSYRIALEAGVKQIRWPGIASLTYGAAFFGADGKVVGTVQFGSSNGFYNGEYLFAAVPAGATHFCFTAPSVMDPNICDNFCVKAYSDDIVAIEPDWVEHEHCLIGLYEANVTNNLMRSISGAAATNNLKCSVYWEDARTRATGFQCIDYEMHKDVANLFFAKYGTRNSQKQCGYGTSTTGTTQGATNSLGFKDTINPNNSTTGAYYYNASNVLTNINKCKVMGYENWQGDSSEWMVGVGLGNGATVTDSLGTSRRTTVHIWQVLLPDGQTTREVMGYNANASEAYITRVRNGRYMDIIPSYCGGSSTTYFGDALWDPGSTNRVVLRSSSIASANGGVAFAYAFHDSSHADTSIGSRLAFRGTINFAETVTAFLAAPMYA